MSKNSFAFIRNLKHPCGHAVDLVAPNAIRPAESVICILSEAPKYGQHSKEILSQLGLSQTQIDELLDQSVTATRWSNNYLPI